MLIYYQCPWAKEVKGYKAWKAEGRQVQKGQIQGIINTNNRIISSQRDMRASALIFDLAQKLCRIEGWELKNFFKEVRNGKVERAV